MRPNIIFHFTDQQRWDTVGCYGQKPDPHHQNDTQRYEGPDGSKKRFAGFEVAPDLRGKQGDYTENYPDYLGQC